MSHPLIAALLAAHPKRLSCPIIPDISVPGCYDAAAQGVEYIIHTASPLPTGDEVPLRQLEAHFMRPAVLGTLSVLDAAARARTVRRVVLTSSIVSLVERSVLDGSEGECPRRTAVSPDSRVADPEEAPFGSEFAAYAASKTAALREAERWMAERRDSGNEPGFDIVFLHPGFVLGRTELAARSRDIATRGTGAVVMGVALGASWSEPLVGATCHVDDVARCHVSALDRKRVPGDGRSYVMAWQARWNDARRAVRRAFPGVAGLPNDGSVTTTRLEFDCTETERVFGMKPRTFEEQVVDVVGQFLELRSKEAMERRGTRRDSVALPLRAAEYGADGSRIGSMGQQRVSATAC